MKGDSDMGMKVWINTLEYVEEALKGMASCDPDDVDQVELEELAQLVKATVREMKEAEMESEQ